MIKTNIGEPEQLYVTLSIRQTLFEIKIKIIEADTLSDKCISV